VAGSNSPSGSALHLALVRRPQGRRGWARQMEVQADRRELPDDPRELQRVTLGQLVERYRETVGQKPNQRLMPGR
jgi:hypothetical protein